MMIGAGIVATVAVTVGERSIGLYAFGLIYVWLAGMVMWFTRKK